MTEGRFDFLEYKEEPPPKGIILQRDVSVAMGPETLGTPGDLSRIWVAFTDQETGEIYLARSDAEWNQWEEYTDIYAPRELSAFSDWSRWLAQDGSALIPAGSEIPEVWIIEPLILEMVFGGKLVDILRYFEAASLGILLQSRDWGYLL